MSEVEHKNECCKKNCDKSGCSKKKCKKLKRKLKKSELENELLKEELEKCKNEIGNTVFCRPFHVVLDFDSNKLGAVTALTPNQLITAYGFNLSTPKPLGRGAKIAIIGAYYYSTLQADLNTYLTRFGLPAKTVKIANLAGNVTNDSWKIELALDVQTIAALVPGADILVVFSKSNSFNDLAAGIKYAVSAGYKVISNSWGATEFSSESMFNSTFNNTTVSYIFASGDTGGTTSYPSAAPNVLSVGGTTLSLNPNNSIQLQSSWQNAGAGPSRYIAKPGYQSNLPGTTRLTPDISAVANPQSGLTIYVSGRGYLIVGGTSLAAPIAAAVITIANSKRTGKSTLTTNTQLQKYLYKTIYVNSRAYANNFYDITVGSVGNIPCKIGYDGCGLGAFKTNVVTQSLVNA